MTHSTKRMLVVFLLVLAFGVGISVPRNQVLGHDDTHWSHNADKMFSSAGITKVGIGTTDPRIPLDFGTGGLFPYQSTDFSFLQNAYDGPAWKYRTGGVRASRMLFNNGWLQYYTAPSGTAGGSITWTEQLTISNTGNVGIANTNPQQKLDLNGNLRITGDILADGTICIGSGC